MSWAVLALAVLLSVSVADVGDDDLVEDMTGMEVDRSSVDDVGQQLFDWDDDAFEPLELVPKGEVEPDRHHSLPTGLPLRRVAVPFYRYYQPHVRDHFYTTNWQEIGVKTPQQVGAHGYIFQGIAGFICPRPFIPALKPLYRYYQGTAHDHFYTLDWHEIGVRSHGQVGKYGYKSEGVAGYCLRRIPRNFGLYMRQFQPLYRYWSGSARDHRYTTNFRELGHGRDGYSYEGVACLVMRGPYLSEEEEAALAALYDENAADWAQQEDEGMLLWQDFDADAVVADDDDFADAFDWDEQGWELDGEAPAQWEQYEPYGYWAAAALALAVLAALAHARCRGREQKAVPEEEARGQETAPLVARGAYQASAAHAV